MATRSVDRHIGIVLPDVAGGGAEKASLTLAASLIERGYRSDLVLLKLSGTYREEIPDGLRLFYWLCRKRKGRALLEYCRNRNINLKKLSVKPLQVIKVWVSLRKKYPELRIRRREARAALGIACYIRDARPQILFAALPQANDAAVLGAELAEDRTPIVVSLRNNVGMSDSYNGRRMTIARALSPKADALVAVSQGVAANAIETLALNARRVRAIYNPKPVKDIRRLADEELSHPWFGDGEPPVILTALRNSPQKDWATLIAAFGKVRRKIHARLAILGRLPEVYRGRILKLAGSLGVAKDIAFLGFDENPYRYMHRASLFVLSSHWEGLPNVLIEAMACGTPVVSTDAPYGPAEILEDGRWGRLTPVGDAPAMAQAIIDSLAGDTVPAEALQRRADDFSVERAVEAYEALFDILIGRGLDSNSLIFEN